MITHMIWCIFISLDSCYIYFSFFSFFPFNFALPIIFALLPYNICIHLYTVFMLCYVKEGRGEKLCAIA